MDWTCSNHLKNQKKNKNKKNEIKKIKIIKNEIESKIKSTNKQTNQNQTIWTENELISPIRMKGDWSKLPKTLIMSAEWDILTGGAIRFVVFLF